MSAEKQIAKITSITIENFKGIGAPVTIPLKPITLMFGANSAGKSTVLQAILLMNDWLQRLGPDLDTLSLGGDKIHLGGFKQFVHRHDESKMVKIRVESSLVRKQQPFSPIDGKKLPCFPEVFKPSNQDDFATVDLNKLEDLQTCFVEIWFGRAYSEKRPYIVQYSVGLNGTWIVSRDIMFSVRLNPLHPVVVNISRQNDGLRKAITLSNIADRSFITAMSKICMEELLSSDFSPRKACIPSGWTVPYELQFSESEYYEAYKENPETFLKADIDERGITGVDLNPLAHLVSQLLLGVGETVSEALSKHIHIGPLRMVPETGRVEEWEKTCWFDGSQAWMEILKPRLGITKNDEMTEDEAVNKLVECLDWLASEREPDEYGALIKTGFFLEVVKLDYKVQCKNSQLLDVDGQWMQYLKGLSKKRGAKLIASQVAEILAEIKKAPVQREVVFLDASNTELRPIDLGTGVSQLMPILIGAVVGGGALSIEEPELHLHPAMQCDLADVFIIRANWGRVSILETHSEHIILRLLRRMRETAAGNAPEGKELTPDDVAVLYLEPASDGIRVTELRVDEEGGFVDEWPNGFFEEGFNEIIGGL
ncbi:AAA family ATPase [Pontiella sulfatireligans]|uniref:AAA domain-containing protein n=1 Tax=Pontiella sulfatireligans TaxID=2750658 RepID=A0A6C2UIC8_9BACT|nr:AAA family ATPase [Pontiella sulfatireligans]VGO19972.1 hypothetical protein SCARR_02032 [Pontiella sulfatireligans]